MIVDIRHREREAIVSLETTRVSRLEKINAAKQEVESLVKQVSQAAEFAENWCKESQVQTSCRTKKL